MNKITTKSFPLYHLTNHFHFLQTPIFETNSVSGGDDFYHDHSFYEIVYIQTGEITHIINDVQQTLTFGDVLFIRPSDKHIFIRKNKPPCSHRDFVFESTFFEEVCNFLDNDLFSIIQAPTLPHMLKLTTEQLNYFEEKTKAFSIASLDNTYKTMPFIKCLLLELLNILYESPSNNKNSQYPPLINDILQSLTIFNLRQYNLSTILSVFKYDNAYLCRLFKKHVGITMTEYANLIRLSYVKEQLSSTQKTINQISNEIGFFSVSHLNKLFKEKYKTTPSEYRKTKILHIEK